MKTLVSKKFDKVQKLKRAEARVYLYRRLYKWIEYDPRRSSKRWEINNPKFAARCHVAGAWLAAILRNPKRLDVLIDAISNNALFFSTRVTPIIIKILKTANLYHDVVNIQKLFDRVSSFKVVWHDSLPAFPWHFAHARPMDECIYFAPTPERALEQKWIRIKPGRYLKKYYPWLSDREVKEWAELHVKKYTSIEVKWATAPEDIARVINEGPSESCQSAGYHKKNRWYRGHVHPAETYGPTEVTGIAAAYIQEENGHITARTLVNIKKKLFARVYGDSVRLIPVLEKQGYKQTKHALIGCRLRIIPNKNGKGFILPYVDADIIPCGGCLDVVKDGQYWQLVPFGKGLSTHCGIKHLGVSE